MVVIGGSGMIRKSVVQFCNVVCIYMCAVGFGAQASGIEDWQIYASGGSGVSWSYRFMAVWLNNQSTTY